jgi:VTC domain.
MAINTFNRYEKKFVIDEVQHKAILPVIMQHMRFDANCSNGREYMINNIYYDTDDSSIIRHSLSKPYYKEKLRMRSYGNMIAPDSKVFLELKKKIGGVVIKRRADLLLSEAALLLESGIRPQPADYISGQVINEIAYFLSSHTVKPAAYISYKRTALFDQDDGDFRITFDRNIITRREDLSLEKGRFGTDLLPGHYLMEVKITGSFPLWFTSLISNNQIYSTGYSKYGQEYTQYLLENKKAYHLPQAV